jgi:hypothetical protein
MYTMSVSRLLKNFLLAGVALAGLVGSTAQAQVTTTAAVPSALSGAYVFSEEGVTAGGARVTTLSHLTFADGGVVTGVAAAQGATGIISYGVQGNYKVDSDYTGTLTLNGTWTDADNGDQAVSENLTLVASASGEINAIRTDAGFFTVAQLLRAGQEGLKGDYLFIDSASDRQYTRLVKLSFDGAGSASGFEIVNTPGLSQRLTLQGTYVSQADGFVSLTLNFQTQDENGDMQNIVENYSCLAGASGARMIRLDSVQPGIFTLAK